MPTMEELILSIEVERDQALKRRDRAIAEVKTILATARNDGRANLTEEEDADVKSAFEKRDIAARDLTGIESKLANARKAKAMEDDVEVALHERGANPGVERPKYDRVARVGAEERTYHKGRDRDGTLFLTDVVRRQMYGDLESEQRILRHMQEERVERPQYLTRAAGTGAFAGLTVPQYLTEMYAPAVAALRPFANVCTHHDLPPDGMTINISRITTATSAALQASENSAVSETNIDDTLLTENVQTIAGQQTLSRQALDRGTGVDGVVMDDLFRRYATTLDNTLILQATTGLKGVATTQTYTDASPTTPKIYGQIVQAMSTVETNLLAWAQPDIAIMHPRRWYGMLSAVGPNWPMIFTPGSGPVQATGVNQGIAYAAGIRGTLACGLSVVVDANLETNLGAGTNQDQIYVTATRECHLWESPDAPVFIRAEQPAAASLGVLLVLYGYFAYTFRRFTGSAIKIDGTGLITPTFSGS
jgi:HK97 family phage major capsid protein